VSAIRLAIIASHPVQYQAPLFRVLAGRAQLHVFFAWRPTAEQQGVGFEQPVQWDSDLTSGYAHTFLANVAAAPAADRFFGCDTPDLGSQLRRGRFDCVLVLGWHLKAFWQAVAACRARGVPLIARGDSQLLTARSLAWGAAKRLIYPIALRAFSAALYVGRRSRAYFEAYGFPANRLFFAPHGVDAAWFAQRSTPAAGRALRARVGAPPERQLLLFAGKLVDFKRPLDVVLAAARLRQDGRDVGVLVAGSGPLEAALRARAEQVGTPLHVAGFLNQTEIPAAYAAADLLALPSTARETWGLVANEALACGLPILVSEAAGCAPDLAADGAAGATFRMGDVAHLAARAADLLDQPPRSERIAARSQTYSIATCANGVLAAAEAVSVTARANRPAALDGATFNARL